MSCVAQKQKPIFPKIPSGAPYVEKRGSGHSEKSWLTRLGGAGNCLQVYVDKGRLTVIPFFPFTLMFLPEIYDLEHVIPIGHVIEASIQKRLWQKGVRIMYRTKTHSTSAIFLWVKTPENLVALLGKQAPTVMRGR
ncbi:MAG: hypothetical protein WBQ60_01945 [Asticcacaulis sp.]